MTSGPGRFETFLLAAVATFTVAVAAASFWWPWAWDAGIFAWVADVIRHGGLPYRDAWDAKGPFSYYAFAMIQQVGGLSMVPVRVFDLALMTLGALGVAAAIRRYAPGTMGPWIGMLLLLGYYASDFWNTSQPDAWVGAIAAIAMPLLLRDDLDRHLVLASLAAFLMGLGLVQKPTFLALVPLPALAMLLLPRRSAGRRVGLASFVTVVALLPAAITAAYFESQGELSRLVDGYVMFNMEMSRQVVGGVGRALFYTLDFAMHTGALPLLVPAAIVGAVQLWDRDRRACLLLLAWCVGMMLCIAAQRRYWGYHWHPFAWSLGPLAGIGLASVFQSGDPRARAGRLLAGAAMGLVGFTLVFPLQRKVREWVHLMAGDYPTRADYFHQFVRDQSDLAGDDIDLAAWLTAHAAPEDRVFIWDSPLPNALSGRRAPGGIGFFGPLVLARANTNEPMPLGPIQQRLRAEFLASLESPATRYVVVSHNAMAGIEPNLRKNVPVLFPAFRDTLTLRWRITDSVGDYRIYERRASTP